MIFYFIFIFTLDDAVNIRVLNKNLLSMYCVEGVVCIALNLFNKL